MARLTVMDRTGDSGTFFNSKEYAEAKEVFDSLMGEGYRAFEKKGEENVVIKTFNPEAEEITMFHQLVGG